MVHFVNLVDFSTAAETCSPSYTLLNTFGSSCVSIEGGIFFTILHAGCCEGLG